MKKFICFVLAFLVGTVLPAHSVEFGQDATGDPNAVHIQGNTSGFLYSERIILTAAHVLDQLKIAPNGDTDGFVYAPGVSDKTNAKRYKIVKAYIPKTYVNLTNNTQPIDDFAVVVLNEDMPVKMKVAIATENQMLSYAQNKTRVELVGYGLQSGSQRSNPQELTRAPHKLSTHLLTPEMMTNHYNQFSQVRPPFWNKIEWGTTLNQKTGTLCNGDSGSGYFVEEDNIRYYVGTAGNGLADSNCQADGVYRPGPGGPIGWFPSPNKFLDLIKTAEIFVADEKQKELKKVEDAKAAAELQAKQEADAKAAALKKITITCLKGKLVKKVTAVKPVCPKGYKKK